MKTLITSEYSKEGIEFIEKNFGEVIYEPWTKIGRGLSESELVNKLKENNVTAFITELDNVSGKVIKSSPNLKFIGVCRGTPVNVDMNAAKEHNIPVFSTPARNAQAVAELLIGLLICFYRNICDSAEYAKTEKWDKAAPYTYFKYQGNELHGKKIGMVGFGAIAKCTEKILDAFGCEVLYYDPYVQEWDGCAVKADLDTIFTESDIVSIHLPLLPSTKGMISRDLLEKMKANAVFANTARAGVVDNDALKEMLAEGKIKGAVLDVFEHEPPHAEDFELIKLDNVLSTPHICGATFEVVNHQSNIINNQLKEHFNII